MARTTTYAPEQKAEALWMWEHDWHPRNIALRIGCSEQTLYAWRSAVESGNLELPSFTPSKELLAETYSGKAPPADEQPPAEPSKAVEQAPLPTMTPNAGALDAWTDKTPPPPERGNGIVVNASELVAELGDTRRQLAEMQRRAVIAESSVVERDATIGQLRRDIDDLEQQLARQQEVAAQALVLERAKSNTYRATIGYLTEVQS